MKLNDYQDIASKTAAYPKEVGLSYVTLGLTGEAGEIANKVKKIYRDNGGVITEDIKNSLAKEVGDVLWYVAMLSRELGFSLEDIAQMNIDKLSRRYERGSIQGSGDDR